MGSQSKPISTSSVSRNIYNNTTTSNPYAYSKTDNSGTLSGFNDGTALNSIYNFVNDRIDSLLDEYLTPNLNTVTNQSKLNSFANTLSAQTRQNFENNIINPLSKRNMLRSSQANDLYKNLIKNNVSSISDYANQLLSESQNNSAAMLKNLLTYYMLGANYLTSMQNHSLNASNGSGTKITNSQTQTQRSFINDDLSAILLSAVLGTVL